MHAKKCNNCRYFRQTFTNSETNYMTKLYFTLQRVYRDRRNKSNTPSEGICNTNYSLSNGSQKQTLCKLKDYVT